MRRFIADLWRSYAHNERGNVFVLFGASAIPLLLVMGGAVDLARFARYKASLSQAVDSAALALARQGEDFDDDEAIEFVENYVAAFNVTDDEFTVSNFDVEETDNGYVVTADGAMDTMFLPLGSLTEVGGAVMSMDMDIMAAVQTASNRLELALVLDNTGSMNCAGTVSVTCANDWQTPADDSRIVALRSAAKSLVNILMKDDMEEPDQIKIALVPFEGMVNVASTGFSVSSPPNWIEWTNEGFAKWNGRNFNTYNVDTDAALERVGHRFLFDKLYANDNTVTWAGCVEMRAGDYELSIDAPNPSIADSLFVPYFAPDEPDNSSTGSSSSPDTRNNNKTSSGATGLTYDNDYLRDKTAPSYPKQSAAQKYPNKYVTPTWHSGRKDTTFSYTYAPNRGCPRPIVALSNADSRATINTAIDNMIAYWHSGTFIPAGLVWGWHVLSSGAPYTEGLDADDEEFEDTLKAIVLLTDGDNQVQPGDANHNNSNYTAYSYVNTLVGTTERRLSTTASASEGTLDGKLEDLCEDVKENDTPDDDSDNIRLYTITFGSLSDDTLEMMENCATLDGGQRLHYHAPNSADLEDIFNEIGEDLSNLHLSM